MKSSTATPKESQTALQLYFMELTVFVTAEPPRTANLPALSRLTGEV